MLKSCKYCGRIHDDNHECSKRHKSVKKLTYIDRFRNTSLWKNKREEIKDRDNYLCQICIRKLFEFKQIYNYSDLQVHHAIPIQVDYDKRLDNDNLITICPFHHRMAEDGRIPYLLIKSIIDEQESTPLPFATKNDELLDTDRPTSFTKSSLNENFEEEHGKTSKVSKS